VFGPLHLGVANLGRAAGLGVICGLVALAFVVAVHGVKRGATALVSWTPLRAAIGGLLVLAMMGLSGTRAYLGLSLPLASVALAGGVVGISVFAWKLVFTSMTLGTGFQGDELTPLFIIGATVAAAVATHLGLPVPTAADLGYVAVFGAAANTPVACTVLAAELFGGSILPFAAVTCLVATLVSTRRSIYTTQRH
jgi:H+/Cl- antiporter ClcA